MQEHCELFVFLLSFGFSLAVCGPRAYWLDPEKWLETALANLESKPSAALQRYHI